MTQKPPDGSKQAPLSLAGWVALAVLLGFFFVSLRYAVQVWTSMAGVPMSGWGWTFLILGILVTTGLGAGLMALVFYSSRHDMDQ
jgi:hypothetical protein